jgi:hypothetical protein
MCGNGRIDVFDAVAENLAAGEHFDSRDLGRDKKSRLPRREWRGKLNQRIERVLLEAVEADAALRDVFALDDFVRMSRVAHAGAEAHTNSNVAPLVDRPSVSIKLSRGGLFRNRCGTRNLSGTLGSYRLRCLDNSGAAGHCWRRLDLGHRSKIRGDGCRGIRSGRGCSRRISNRRLSGGERRLKGSSERRFRQSKIRLRCARWGVRPGQVEI